MGPCSIRPRCFSCALWDPVEVQESIGKASAMPQAMAVDAKNLGVSTISSSTHESWPGRDGGAFPRAGPVLPAIEPATELEFERVKLAAKKQLAFYGSTPAYRPTLLCHGWDALHTELNRLSKQGRWEEMSGLIDDEVLETLAVVGPRDEISSRLTGRLKGIADAVSTAAVSSDMLGSSPFVSSVTGDV